MNISPRTLEVILVRDTIGQNEVSGTRDPVYAEILAVFGMQVEPVFSKGSDIAANVLSTPVYLASVFQTLSGDFKEETMLGVQLLKLIPGDGEEGRIEAVEVLFIEEVPMLRLD